MNIDLKTSDLADSIKRLVAHAGEADERMIQDLQRLRDEQTAAELKRSYEQAIEALRKSQSQKAGPVRKKIAEALVQFAVEYQLPIALADKAPRRRRQRKAKPQPSA